MLIECSLIERIRYCDESNRDTIEQPHVCSSVSLFRLFWSYISKPKRCLQRSRLRTTKAIKLVARLRDTFYPTLLNEGISTIDHTDKGLTWLSPCFNLAIIWGPITIHVEVMSASIKWRAHLHWHFAETKMKHRYPHIDGLVQDSSNFNALAMELLQSCAKPSICYCNHILWGKCFFSNHPN